METLILNQLNVELSVLIVGWLSIIFGLIVKDFLTNFAHGIMFYFDKHFNEGDVIYISNVKYIIVKIGIMNSIFLNEKERRWTYVRNSRLQFLQLERDIKGSYE